RPFFRLGKPCADPCSPSPLSASVAEADAGAALFDPLNFLFHRIPSTGRVVPSVQGAPVSAGALSGLVAWRSLQPSRPVNWSFAGCASAKPIAAKNRRDCRPVRCGRLGQQASAFVGSDDEIVPAGEISNDDI